MQNQRLEEQRRQQYLDQLQKKEEKFRKSQSKREHQLQRQQEVSNVNKQHKENYLRKLQEHRERVKEAKLKKLLRKEAYIKQLTHQKAENDRLRSMIQVQSKFKALQGSPQLKLNHYRAICGSFN